MFPQVLHPFSHLDPKLQKANLNLKSSAEQTELYKFLQTNTDLLRSATHLASFNSHYYKNKPGESLRLPNCGRATSILSYLLRKNNYKTTKLETTKLNTELFNSAHLYTGHAILEVELIDGTKVLIDPTYSQFLTLTYLCYPFPKEEILAIPTGQVDEQMEFFTELRQRHFEEEIFLEFSPLADISDDELKKYFAHIWNRDVYQETEDNLIEKQLERFFERNKSNLNPKNHPISKMAKLIGYSGQTQSHTTK